MKILAISGSLREASTNTAILKNLQKLDDNRGTLSCAAVINCMLYFLLQNFDRCTDDRILKLIIIGIAEMVYYN